MAGDSTALAAGFEFFVAGGVDLMLPAGEAVCRGSTYVEDFENKKFNISGIASTNGRLFDSPERSVDEDDGVRDNLGIGWCLTANESRPLEGSPYWLNLAFSLHSSGHYPAHGGIAILGFTVPNFEGLRYFQTFNADGAPILENPLTALVLDLPGATNTYSSTKDTVMARSRIQEPITGDLIAGKSWLSRYAGNVLFHET